MASGLPEEVRIFPAQMAVPSYVLDPLWNACAANDAARHLFTGWLNGKERNLLRYVFLTPAAHSFLDNWENSARRVLAEFRAVSIRGDKQQVDALVRELRCRSPDFERLWHNQSVLLREGGPRKFHHPIDGPVDFDQTDHSHFYDMAAVSVGSIETTITIFDSDRTCRFFNSYLVYDRNDASLCFTNSVFS